MPTPIPIETYTTKEDKVDANAAADINALQNSVITLETALNLLLNTNGTLIQGTSFPGSPSEGQFFWRTDLQAGFIYSAVATAWQQLGGTLSNLLFQYQGQVDQVGVNKGEYVGTSFAAAGASGNYRYLISTVNGATMWSTKFKKIAGVNTVTIECRLFAPSAGITLTVSIGGQSGSSSAVNTSTPTWASFTIDVSGLTNNTVYDVLVSGTMTGAQGCCANIIGWGS